MDTDLTDDQEELRRSARDFLSVRVPNSVVRAMEINRVGSDLALWKELASLGWQGVMIPEAHGGSGLGFIELAILVEEIGRALCPGPLLPTFIATLAILDAASIDQSEAWLPSIAAGDAIWTPALVEAAGSWHLHDVTLQVSTSHDGLRLDGIKSFVQDAHVADWLLVIGASETGPVAVAVRRDTAGIATEELLTIGSDRQFVVRFDGVRVPACHRLGSSDTRSLEILTQKAAVLESAYLTGLSRRDLELAVDHVANRNQFGQPLGSFQAVQHACANMLTDVDGAWLATYKAAWAFDTEQPDAALSAAIAKAWTSDASARVVSMCQQLSGAMGFTKDYDAQLYFRRQKRAELSWGDADFHRERVAALLDRSE